MCVRRLWGTYVLCDLGHMRLSFAAGVSGWFILLSKYQRRFDEAAAPCRRGGSELRPRRRSVTVVPGMAGGSWQYTMNECVSVFLFLAPIGLLRVREGAAEGRGLRGGRGSSDGRREQGETERWTYWSVCMYLGRSVGRWCRTGRSVGVDFGETTTVLYSTTTVVSPPLGAVSLWT